jgi:hypothetical protein
LIWLFHRFYRHCLSLPKNYSWQPEAQKLSAEATRSLVVSELLTDSLFCC